MSLSSYGKLATEVYDIDKPIGRSFGDVEFYLARLSSCGGRILEPAVGTGRVLIPLLEGGLVVEGVDSSPEMLAVCRTRCAERRLEAVIHEADIRSLSLPERYEAIIIPAGSFLLIESREESLGALRRFHEHLVPGGRLILDLELQTDFRTNVVSTRTWETLQGETITIESKLVEVNFLEQYTVSHLRYDKWRDGELVKTELQRFPLRWYGLEEFELSSIASGLPTWWYPPTMRTVGDRPMPSRPSPSRRVARNLAFSLLPVNEEKCLVIGIVCTNHAACAWMQTGLALSQAPPSGDTALGLPGTIPKRTKFAASNPAI